MPGINNTLFPGFLIYQIEVYIKSGQFKSDFKCPLFEDEMMEKNDKHTNIKRNSSIELLRIIMMLQIIFLHVSTYGDYNDIAIRLRGRTELTYWLIWFMCRCPVFIFVIIMGYFLSETKSDFNKGRLIKCYVPMYFYSLLIPLLWGISRPGELDTVDIFKAFIPFLSRTWYFMTLYLLVLILSPFLNKMLRQLNRKEFLYLIIICFFMFSIWQPLSILSPFDEVIGLKKILSTQGGKSLYDFIYMYILGAYMRRYHIFRSHEDDDADDMWNNPLVYLVGFLLLGLINVIIVYNYPDKGIESAIAYNDNPFVVIQCTCLFRFFEKLDISRHEKLCRFINYVSAGNLGIYMIHEHPLIRNYIWGEIFATDKISFYTQRFYLIKIFMFIVLIYVCCWVIDWFRRMIFDGVKKLKVI